MDNGIYDGTNTSTLTLHSPPTIYNGTKYRCLTNTGTGLLFSPEFILKIIDRWTGEADTNWNNPMNWSCGQVPDANTEVIVAPGLPHYPIVSTNSACKRLVMLNGTTIIVSVGVVLDITGKQLN